MVARTAILSPRPAGVYRALDSFGSGTLTCTECGRTRACTPDDAARYLEFGWPKCHEQTMRLEYPKGPPADGS